MGSHRWHWESRHSHKGIHLCKGEEGREEGREREEKESGRGGEGEGRRGEE